MKYFTKEWYQKMQESNLAVGLKPSKRCERFDEVFYQKTYKRKEKEYLNFQKKLYNFNPKNFLKIYKESFDNQINEEELNYLIESENYQILLEEYHQRPAFNDLMYKEKFIDLTSPNSEFGRNYLKKIPENIKSKILDLRLFLLGYATKEIIEELQELSIRNKEAVEAAFRGYQEENKGEGLALSFHDFEIKDIIKEDQELIINFHQRILKSRKLIFLDVEIIEFEEFESPLYWLYEEVYSKENGYEIHLMFTGAKYLTFRCSDFIII